MVVLQVVGLEEEVGEVIPRSPISIHGCCVARLFSGLHKGHSPSWPH